MAAGIGERFQIDIADQVGAGESDAAAPIALRTGKTSSLLSLRSSRKLCETRFHVFMQKAYTFFP